MVFSPEIYEAVSTQPLEGIVNTVKTKPSHKLTTSHKPKKKNHKEEKFYR